METIEEMADAYCREHAQQEGYDAEDVRTAYISGAEHKREELTAHYEAEIAKYKRDLKESRERENIACKAVAEKRDKIARLTKWHDPKEPPEAGRVVLVKRNPSSIIPYDLGHIDNDGNWVDSWCGSPIDDKIIGWREIHE
jgi:hypothetical protein